MERREVIAGFGGIAALSMMASAAAQSAKPAAKAAPAANADAHHHHGTSAKTEVLVDALNECIAKGEACLAHCLMLLGDGDKSVAGCAKSVNEVTAICESLRKLANQGSRHATTIARVAMTACEDCEKECRKHETKHQECRACAKACAECARECKAFLA